MGNELKNIKKLIDQKISEINEKNNTNYTDKDVLYLIPMPQKSYTPIALQYANVNNIPTEKFSLPSGRNYIELEEHKIYVILDDVAATSSSFDKNFYQYLHDFEQDNHILFCPISAGQTGKFIFDAWVSGKKRENRDFFVTDSKNSHKKLNNTDFYKNLSLEQKIMFKDLFFGFCSNNTYPLGIPEILVNIAKLMHSVNLPGGGYAFCFPYMTPDNNAALPYFLFRNLFLNSLSDSAIKNMPPHSQTVGILEKLDLLN
jgi:hypothetical protein